MPLQEFEQEAVENCDDLAACNHTELYQLCRTAGRKVLPSDSKTLLAAVLEGEQEGTSPNPIDALRDGLMDFLIAHWRRIHAQLFCPAKSGDPRACYGCCDAQVIHCLTINPKIEPVIIERLKEMEQQVTPPTLTVDTIPRDLDSLKAISPFLLRRFAIDNKLLDTAEKRSAFTSLSVLDQVNFVADFLKQHDAANAKPTKSADPTPAPQATAPDVVTTPVEEPPPPPIKRTPRGRPPAAPETCGGGGCDPAKLEEVVDKVLQAKLTAFQQDLAQKMGSLHTLISEVSSKVTDVQQKQDALTVQQQVVTAVSLLLAQEVLRTSRPEILSVAVSDLTDIEAAMGKALNGK